MTADQLVLARPGAWTDHAVCRSEDPDLFFPIGSGTAFTEQIDEAKAVCRICPVRPECFDYATTTAQQGIWGGTTEDERRQIRAGQLPTPEPAETPGETVTVHAINPNRDEQPTGEPVGIVGLEALLHRAEASESAATRRAGQKARAAVEDLRQRVNAEAAEAKVLEEIAALEKQLAAKQEKLRELRPAKKSGKPHSNVPDGIEPKDIRAWATERGIKCPERGVIPKTVVDQYMAAIQ